MSVLRIALLQLSPEPADEAANLNRAVWACRVAKERGADIALFPEMWNIGSAPPLPDAWDDPWPPDNETERSAWWARAVDERCSTVYRTCQ